MLLHLYNTTVQNVQELPWPCMEHHWTMPVQDKISCEGILLNTLTASGLYSPTLHACPQWNSPEKSCSFSNTSPISTLPWILQVPGNALYAAAYVLQGICLIMFTTSKWLAWPRRSTMHVQCSNFAQIM